MMPRLHYSGQSFELEPSAGEEDIVSRIDHALETGRQIVANTKVPTNMILGVVRLANGNDLVFGFSGSLPIAIESDGPADTRSGVG
jgi:hypothetical protein